MKSTHPKDLDLQNMLEELIKKRQYKFYEQWITNFSLNLNDIWNESSASILAENKNTKTETAIVIGKGPSLKKNKHLELLANSDFKGSVVCCDGILISALKNGVTPDKFPNFYTVTIDPYPEIIKNYDDDIIQDYGKKIKGVFTTISSPNAVNCARNKGIKIHWIHSLFDYNEGRKSFNYISAKIVRAKNHLNGLPAIQTGGNIGTASWFIAWKILHCNTVGLIGINHGWEEDDSWETIISHGKNNLDNLFYTENYSNHLFKKVYNPDFNCVCVLDPLFQFYSLALKEFIYRAPKWVKTINATEGGSIFGKRINCISFREFLKKYKF